MSEDIVNPKRYTQNKLECWDFWLKAGLDPLIASAVNVHHSMKVYLIVRSEMESLSDLQYTFMLLATRSTGTHPYVTNCEDMIGLVDDMIKEIS